MNDDLKSTLLRINGVDERLAGKIVNSGVSLRQLHSAVFIALAYEIDDSGLAKRIRFAAGKFARTAIEGGAHDDELEIIRYSKVSEEALVALGLNSRDAETLVLFEARCWDLALENPENLWEVLGFGKRDCVRAIAWARLITMYEGEAGDLVEFLKQRE
ncbi:MAG: hypothetical protein WAV56_01275 [Microgenomates group bacterium]